MTTPASHSSLEPTTTSWALSLTLVAVFAVIGLAICFAGQNRLQASNAENYSAPALFNQANADARSNKTALAIAGYERAKMLAPDDDSIRANLNWIRTHAGLPPIIQNWQDRLVSWASPNTMAWLGSLGVILMGTAWILGRPDAKGRSLFGTAGIIGTALLALAIASAVLTWQTAREAVVLTMDAPARISPTTLSEAAFKLRSGEIITMRGKHGDFVLIADPTGRAGWVKQMDLDPIIPN